MVQAASDILEQLKVQGSKPALYLSQGETHSYGSLKSLTERATGLLRTYGVGVGTGILLGVPLSAELYATVIAASLMGAKIVLVEPWMPLAAIDRAIAMVAPQVFISNTLGRLWGLRVPSIRKIPHWVSVTKLSQSPREPLQSIDMAPEAPCLITFTTGTTGEPKGVVRSHGYLVAQGDVITKSLGTANYSGADLVVFANIALLNLGLGRSSVVMRRPWGKVEWNWLGTLADTKIESIVCGPAVLERLLGEIPLPSLQAMFVGGALSDCHLLERAVQCWRDARLVHVYGSTEVEPVSYTTFGNAIAESRRLGSFQATYLGTLTPEITVRGSGSLSPFWVSGKHVAGEYLGLNPANRTHKERDASGVLWHRMGDQVIIDKERGVWYQGREGDSYFGDEQRLYYLLGHSRAFIAEIQGKGLAVVGEGVSSHTRVIKATFPAVKTVIEASIIRDRRHRARIDRQSTLAGCR